MSFINKTGAIFVPKKVARRRPGATAVVSSRTPASTAETNASTISTPASTADETPQPSQLPTPAATQDAAHSGVSQNAQVLGSGTSNEPPLASTDRATAPRTLTPPPSASTSVSAPPSTQTERLQEGLDALTSTLDPSLAIPAVRHTNVNPSEPPTEHTACSGSSAPPAESTVPSWAAVNDTQSSSTAPSSTAKPRERGRRRRKAVTLQDIDDEDDDETQAEGNEDVQPPATKLTARGRGKRKATEETPGEEGEAAQRPVKRRPTRRGTATSASAEAPEHTDEIVEGSAPAVLPRPRQRKRKRQTATQAEGDQEQPEGERPAKRKGRPPREATPSDAENEEIDPANTFMDDLIESRTGRLSQREKKMREINWDEVEAKRKERERAQLNSRAARAEVDQQLNEAELAAREAAERAAGPRYVMIDGQMQIAHDSGTINRGDDTANFELMETVEEDDFTNRINTKSFMRNNKRYPEELLLPGQGKRWNIKDTEDFYEALTMFGTDFTLMSTLFEGVSRRSLKLKFNREERLNPDRIDEILKSRTAVDFNHYLAVTGREEGSFIDVQKWEEEHAAREREFEEQLEEARAAAEEDLRQRRIAGAVVDGEDGTSRGRKGKGKQVAWDLPQDQQGGEDGVEVLADDDDWHNQF